MTNRLGDTHKHTLVPHSTLIHRRSRATNIRTLPQVICNVMKDKCRLYRQQQLGDEEQRKLYC